jgi:hypothetical protein
MKTNQFLSLLFVTLLSTAVFNSCKKDDKDDAPPASTVTATPDAKITGTVKTPSGQIVGSARVSAGTYNTITDQNGVFTLDVYHGTYTLRIETGTGSLFRTELNISVAGGETKNIDPAQSVLTQVGTMAHIPGSYDNIEDIITALGYTSTSITMADLGSTPLLSGYDALFFNCGCQTGNATMDSAKYTNLAAFLVNGGSIYASDYAVQLLTGDGNWKLAAGSNKGLTHDHKNHGGNSVLSTCLTPMLGGLIEDSSLCTSKSGPAGMVTGANVIDPFIVNLLGSSTIDINYDLGSWEVISLHDAPFSPVITDANNNPLAVKSAQFGEDGGIIFYTTFHNEPQGTVSSDVEDILEYFILNL